MSSPIESGRTCGHFRQWSAMEVLSVASSGKAIQEGKQVTHEFDFDNCIRQFIRQKQDSTCTSLTASVSLNSAAQTLTCLALVPVVRFRGVPGHSVVHPPQDEPPPPDDGEDKEKRTDDIPAWDQESLKVDQGALFELILAANYLDIKGLLDVICKTVAIMIKRKTPEEIRKTFNIKNDFKEEEEAQVPKENQWCEEK
ncbi:hypothetical protein J1605_004835 [Eschrichtius robustus]|uniref:S-phase kinase-associated protein 1 n=1 Tax=Eschrichtius robustus TaxID=9764 RepID=A0AB34HA80_ESCRO|nr:hypothetical protein J1605_004835 [Eschrichtius robustus]